MPSTCQSYQIPVVEKLTVYWRDNNSDNHYKYLLKYSGFFGLAFDYYLRCPNYPHSYRMAYGSVPVSLDGNATDQWWRDKVNVGVSATMCITHVYSHVNSMPILQGRKRGSGKFRNLDKVV